jgi:cytochrome P450
MKLFAEGAPEVFYSRYNGGHWIVVGYEAARRIAANPSVFSSSRVIVPLEADPAEGGMILNPIELDPPHHSPARRALTQAFSPSMMRALEPEIRARAIELIEKVASKGGCEFVAAISEPYPVMIIMRVVGLDYDRFPQFRQWAMDFTYGGGDPVVKKAGMENISQTMKELIRERQSEPQGDMITRLLQSKDEDGKPQTLEDIHSQCILLFLGGLETVTTGLSQSFRYLAMDADFQASIRADRSLIPQAVEELLRRNGPASLSRVVFRDAEEGGVQFKKGDMVTLFYPATGLDPKTYLEPSQCLVGRKTRAHMAFGSGPHTCWGAPLARLEYRVLLEEFLDRVPQFRLDISERIGFRGGAVLALDHLPLQW